MPFFLMSNFPIVGPRCQDVCDDFPWWIVVTQFYSEAKSGKA